MYATAHIAFVIRSHLLSKSGVFDLLNPFEHLLFFTDLNQVNDDNENCRHQLTTSRAIPQSEPPANTVNDEKDEVNPQSESIITSPKVSAVVGKETMQFENPIPNDCRENDSRLTVIANDQRPEIQSSSVSDEVVYKLFESF